MAFDNGYSVGVVVVACQLVNYQEFSMHVYTMNRHVPVAGMLYTLIVHLLAHSVVIKCSL